jgi:pimeloyl-ACP methyl ester carboxylesterase
MSHMYAEEFKTDFQGYKIWYRVAKPTRSESDAPVLLLHGGPGLGSDYLSPLEDLSDQGRTVIRFDQLGCGRSDRPRDLELWKIEGCIQQIDHLRKVLGLETLHLLGHSWGGMVALQYLLSNRPGVQSIILCSSVVSVRLWAEEARRLLALMPSHISKALLRCANSLPEAKPPELGQKPNPSRTQEEIDRKARWMKFGFRIISWSPFAWLAAFLSYLPIPVIRNLFYLPLSIQFSLLHECRQRPMPFDIFRSLAGNNGELNEVLMGPSQFLAGGVYEDWDIRPCLPQIDCPTLILSGRDDVATPNQMAVLRGGITGSKQIILEHSSHCGMWEEPDKFRAAILDFVNRVEIEAVKC